MTMWASLLLGSAPFQMAATSPARTNEDFPLPEGPTTARKPASARRARTSATSASRPKKKLGVLGLKRLQPLVGAYGVGRWQHLEAPVLRSRCWWLRRLALCKRRVVFTSCSRCRSRLARAFCLSLLDLVQALLDLREHPAKLFPLSRELGEPLERGHP